MKQPHVEATEVYLNALNAMLIGLRSSPIAVCLKKDKSCDLLMHSSLVIGLMKRNFWPLEQFPKPGGCLPELKPRLLKLLEDDLRIHNPYERQHANC